MSNCAICHVLQRSDWSVMDPAELDRIGRIRRRREYRAGKVIFEAGQENCGIYCVSVGTVGIRRMDENGNSALLSLAYPGDTLGYRSFLCAGEHRTSAEALGPATVCLIDGGVLRELFAGNPALARQFLHRASRELEHAHDSLFHHATLSNRARLARLLVQLMKRHGRSGPDGSQIIELPVSRRDLASMVGARHETVSRIMTRLAEDGIAEFSGRRVHIPKVENLLAEVYSNAAA
jgi:CRP/FNR family transcriptional regulator